MNSSTSNSSSPLPAEMEESKQAKGPPHITCPLKIAAALKEMLAVGFKDVRGMLTRLLEWNEGEIHRVVDVLNVNDHYILFKTLYKGNKVIPFHVLGITSIKLNVELIALGFTVEAPARPMRKTASWMEHPKVDKRFRAKVSWINEKGSVFLQDVRNQPELEMITSDLNDKYKKTRPSEGDSSYATGDICIAKHRDGNWSRAVIRGFSVKEVDVHFIDWGTLDTVNIKDIRLDVDFEDVPVQAVRCTLHNLEPTCGGQNWLIRDLNAIYRLAAGVEFKVKVMADGPPIQVELIPERGRVFNKELVVKQLAKFIEISEPEKKKSKRCRK